MSVIAKMRVQSVTKFLSPEGSARVVLNPVFGDRDDPKDVNKKWSQT